MTAHTTVTDTRVKFAWRQRLASVLVFGAVLLGVVSIDERVRERFQDLVYGGSGVASWGHRSMDLGDALMSAVRHQSIENAPLVIFATVSAVLVLFMLKT